MKNYSAGSLRTNMYGSPTPVNFESLFDILFWALKGAEEKETYTVLIGKVKIPKDMDYEQIYAKYGPCGPNPFYYIRIYTVGGQEVKLERPYNYLTVSQETLQKLRDKLPLTEIDRPATVWEPLTETLIPACIFTGHSFLFTPATHQKSPLFGQMAPVEKKNKCTTWMSLPAFCIDREGQSLTREDQY